MTKAVTYECDNCGDEIHEFEYVENEIHFQTVSGNHAESFHCCDYCRRIVQAMFCGDNPAVIE
jgi:hypothetical protein